MVKLIHIEWSYKKVALFLTLHIVGYLVSKILYIRSQTAMLYNLYAKCDAQ